MKIIEDFTHLKELLPELKKYTCVVIIACYNYGKSSICTDIIHDYFGEENTYYVTFTDQSKPGFTPRKSRLKFNELVEDKIIVFDEISDDEDRDIRAYLKSLISANKVIILTNPYGTSNLPENEIVLFTESEKDILPVKTIFIFVKNRIG